MSFFINATASTEIYTLSLHDALPISPTAAQIWGVSNQEYEDKADVWPLNPNGELLLGIKVEDKYALDNAEQTLKVPGIGFAEWGPGDMALSLGIRTPNAAEKDPKMLAARARVFAACKA